MDLIVRIAPLQSSPLSCFILTCTYIFYSKYQKSILSLKEIFFLYSMGKHAKMANKLFIMSKARKHILCTVPHKIQSWVDQYFYVSKDVGFSSTFKEHGMFLLVVFYLSFLLCYVNYTLKCLVNFSAASPPELITSEKATFKARKKQAFSLDTKLCKCANFFHEEMSSQARFSSRISCLLSCCDLWGP